MNFQSLKGFSMPHLSYECNLTMSTTPLDQSTNACMCFPSKGNGQHFPMLIEPSVFLVKCQFSHEVEWDPWIGGQRKRPIVCVPFWGGLLTAVSRHYSRCSGNLLALLFHSRKCLWDISSPLRERRNGNEIEDNYLASSEQPATLCYSPNMVAVPEVPSTNQWLTEEGPTWCTLVVLNYSLQNIQPSGKSWTRER